MIDAIDRSELRGTIQGWRDAHADVDDADGVDILDDVLLLIDAQSILTPPNEWVSVEERLPERGKDVLLYFEEESRISVGGRYDVGDGWYAVIVNEYETICDTSPRYWMPLPKSPKEDE